MPARFGFAMIGIGASAGDAEVPQSLFRSMPADLDAALVGALREALASGQRVVCPPVEVALENRVQAVVLTVAPLPRCDLPEPPLLVTVADGVPSAMPERPAGPARQDGTPVQSERESLRSRIEACEAATEALQSVKEELRRVNLEFSAKLDRADADLRHLSESARIAAIFLDRNMLVRGFTPAASAIVDLRPGDVGRPLADCPHRLEQVDFRQEVARMLERPEPIERRVALQDSEGRYLMRLLPCRTAEGGMDGAIITFTDVSGVVEAEILATMVAELNHRVRNLLQVVMAVFQRTLRRATSLEEFATAFRGRVLALARAHEMVSAAGWKPVPLRDLARKELDPYADGKARILLEGPSVTVSPRTALALGMVLHELATNASKYGALSAPQGHVMVSWMLEGPGSRALRLRWTEGGGPPVVAPQRRGFGSELIERQVRHDLHGTVSLEFVPGGLRAELVLPLDAAAAG